MDNTSGFTGFILSYLTDCRFRIYDVERTKRSTGWLVVIRADGYPGFERRHAMDVRCQARRFVSTADADISLSDLNVVWAATTRDEDYLKLQGLKRLVSDASHRKEVVAGNLDQYIVSGTY